MPGHAEPFYAVGGHYRDFTQTEDEEVVRLLAEAQDRSRWVSAEIAAAPYDHPGRPGGGTDVPPAPDRIPPLLPQPQAQAAANQPRIALPQLAIRYGGWATRSRATPTSPRLRFSRAR